jgi:hypothetical protein
VIDLDCLARLREAGAAIKASTNAHDKSVEVWVGESSNVWTGGQPNISDVLFDGFYYVRHKF